MCTFWLAHALALAGRLEEAVQTFQVAAGAANDLGLIAEEIDLAGGELLGNYPQAFSDVGLVTAASAISERLDGTLPSGQRTPQGRGVLTSAPPAPIEARPALSRPPALAPDPENQEDPMPRIPVHTVADAAEQSRDELKALEARRGKVLTIHGEMAHARWSCRDTSPRSAPSASTARSTPRPARRSHSSSATWTAASTASPHTVSAKRAGFREDQTVAIRDGRFDTDPKLAALLALVRASAANVGHVPDAVWQDALDAGWSDVQLTEASVHIALNLFTNHFNHLVGSELDVPRAPGL